MPKVEFRPVTRDAIEAIAADMRQADVAEIWASNRAAPLEALTVGAEVSKLSAAVWIDDQPVAMLGLRVNDILSGKGVPWLLSTDTALKHKREFFTLVPDVIEQMLDMCPCLYNYVHAENKVSIRWLKWIGFTVEDAAPYGLNSELFHKFTLER